ncbi:MAG TPA: hypothetical protein VKB51_13950 [bacterium]|jgi:hypothetical protein|nr:hypothetical protein [bacterium]
MLAGKIHKLDLVERTVVVLTDDGREVTAKVPASASIEVSEPEAMGTMGGTLEDLEEGYLVELEVHEAHEDHPCTCISLVSIS